MKKQILLLVFSFVCMKMVAQTVTLGIHQNYIPVITQHGDTLVSSKSEGNQWYKNDVVIVGATGQIYICTEAAYYKVVVTYAPTGCSSSSEKYDVKTALESIKADFSYKVYPNPSNGMFNLQFVSDITGKVQLELYACDGKLIIKNQVESGNGNQIVTFGDSGLVKGVYNLRIRTSTGVANKLIVVQ